MGTKKNNTYDEKLEQIKKESEVFCAYVRKTINSNLISYDLDREIEEKYIYLYAQLSKLKKEILATLNNPTLSSAQRYKFNLLIEEMKQCSNSIDVFNDEWDSYSNKMWTLQVEDVRKKFDQSHANTLTMMSLLLTIVTILVTNIKVPDYSLRTIVISNSSVILAVTVMFFMIKNIHGNSFKKFFTDPMNYVLVILIIGLIVAIILLAKYLPDVINDTSTSVPSSDSISVPIVSPEFSV